MKICIFGLGRIGLPIALVCADSGYKVTGIDVNTDLIQKLKKGLTGFNESGLIELLEKHLNKNFYPKHQDDDIISDLRNSEFIIITVGTGFAKYPDKPDLSTLYSIIDQLITVGLKDKTIILRVTLPIGTSDEIRNIIEDKSGLTEGKDFWFSFVPERLMEGKAVSEERVLPKIVGSYSQSGFLRVSSFFEKIGGDIVRVSNPRTAEFIKLIDNSWRNTRFSFANELAFLAEEKGIDVIESIKSANMGYDRNEIPLPGPVSGYCLGKDPYLLELAFEGVAKRRGFNSLWYYGRRANDWLIDKIVAEVKGNSILIAGLSFKEDIDDFRHSHSIDIIRKFVNLDYKVYACDPFLGNNNYTKLPNDLENKVVAYKKIEDALKEEIDCVIISTRHSEYRKFKVDKLKISIKIIDLWNLFRDKEKMSNYEALGLGKKK
jgi:UDP-N-acetyl-D-mannosaminuronic acid dehydrogenase